MRQYLFDVLLLVLDDAGGELPTREALRQVGQRAMAHVPENWLGRFGGYAHKFLMFTAYERKRAQLLGLLGPSPVGIWELSQTGRKAAAAIRAGGGPRPAAH